MRSLFRLLNSLPTGPLSRRFITFKQGAGGFQAATEVEIPKPMRNKINEFILGNFSENEPFGTFPASKKKMDRLFDEVMIDLKRASQGGCKDSEGLLKVMTKNNEENKLDLIQLQGVGESFYDIEDRRLVNLKIENASRNIFAILAIQLIAGKKFSLHGNYNIQETTNERSHFHTDFSNIYNKKKLKRPEIIALHCLHQKGSNLKTIFYNPREVFENLSEESREILALPIFAISKQEYVNSEIENVVKKILKESGIDNRFPILCEKNGKMSMEFSLAGKSKMIFVEIEDGDLKSFTRERIEGAINEMEEVLESLKGTQVTMDSGDVVIAGTEIPHRRADYHTSAELSHEELVKKISTFQGSLSPNYQELTEGKLGIYFQGEGAQEEVGKMIRESRPSSEIAQVLIKRFQGDRDVKIKKGEVIGTREVTAFSLCRGSGEEYLR